MADPAKGVPTPLTTIAIILGADEWPGMPSFRPAPQFTRSARDFHSYLLNGAGLALPSANVLSLFNSPEPAPVLAEKIEEFIERARESAAGVRDILVYYTGHGGFDPGSLAEYYLAVRKTRNNDPASSSLTIKSLRRALMAHGRQARRYLVLDCCFAGEAAKGFYTQSANVQAMRANVRDEFPTAGTALLCASSAANPAKYRPDEPYTSFSGALLSALQFAPAKRLSLHELGEHIRSALVAQHADQASRPEVHSPEQSEGSVADVALLPVIAHHQDQAQPRPEPEPEPEPAQTSAPAPGPLAQPRGSLRQRWEANVGALRPAISAVGVVAITALHTAAARAAAVDKRLRSLSRRPWVLVLMGALAVLATLAVVATEIAIRSAARSMPAFEELWAAPRGQSIRVHAADDSVILELGGRGEWLPIEKISKPFVDAVVAAKDPTFYQHAGLNALGRGQGDALPVAGISSGASPTIERRLARSIFMTKVEGWSGWFRERLLAVALSRKFTKAQLLELFLNRVTLGQEIVGVDAAARTYFGHAATSLTPTEAALLAGQIDAPQTAQISSSVDLAKFRGMVVAGRARLTTDLSKLQIAPRASSSSASRYFTDWVLPQLENLIDDDQSPLDVWTTLDPKMQQAAERMILPVAPTGAQAALIALDKDGAVRAMVGGTNYNSSQFNFATRGGRTAGPSWQLFVYLAALEAGHRPDDRVIDEPTRIRGWEVRNSTGKFSGQMTLRTAFANSVNSIAAKLGQESGFGTVADMARRFGISTPVSSNPRMVEGTTAVRLIDMTRAFASTASKGVAIAPYGITRVSANNQVIFEYKVDGSRVLVAPWVATQMIDLLQTAVNSGVAKPAGIGRPVAGQFGTSFANKDSWFIGFSSGLTTGVWIGRDDTHGMPQSASPTSAPRIFAGFMRTAIGSRPVQPFDTKVVLPGELVPADTFSAPDNGVFVDEDGNPIARVAPTRNDAALDQQWLDRVLDRAPKKR